LGEFNGKYKVLNFHRRCSKGDRSLETTEKIQEALNADGELEGLRKKPAILDEKILALEEIRFPSSQEQQEIKLLKKEKLAIKTQLETMENH